MEQINQILSQPQEPWTRFQPHSEVSSATPTLSGSVSLLGAAYTIGPQRELFVGVPQSLFEQRPQPPTLAIPGRVTGPVRLVQKVASAWALTDEELASLLAYPSPRLAADLLAGNLTFAGNEDRNDRARLIYLIHSTLSDLFVDAGREQQWVRAKNALLDNKAPLDVMTEKRIPGMLFVREIVERHLAHRR